MSEEGRAIMNSSLLEKDSYRSTDDGRVNYQGYEAIAGTGHCSRNTFWDLFRFWPFYSTRTLAKKSGRFVRLIDRDGAFFQSKGQLAIKRKIHVNLWRTFYMGDLFHSLVDAPTSRIVAFLFTAYVVVIIMYALTYWSVSCTYGCNMGIKSFVQAYIFSLQTMATIGYGTGMGDVFL